MSENNISILAKQVHDFVSARKWCDGHNPKNLAMAISVEVGELCEIFRWLSIEEGAGVRFDTELLDATADEIGDVFILLLSLCNSLGLDPSSTIINKIKKNEEKYPALDCVGWSTTKRPKPVGYSCSQCEENR